MKSTVNVVSLKRSTGRRDAFLQNNRHVNFEFFDAVDGTMLTMDAIRESQLFEEGLPYSAGAYGCALSHLWLWDMAIRKDGIMIVAEDDAIFRFDFEEQYLRLIRELPADWDILIFGWNFDSILSLNIMPGISPVVAVFNQDQLRSSVDNFQKLNENSYALRLDKCFGMPAYAITPSGARKFTSLCFPLINFELFFPLFTHALPNTGIDITMNKYYSITKSYCCFPPLTITKNERDISTVQNDVK